MSVIVSYANNLKQWVIQPIRNGKHLSTVLVDYKPTDDELYEMFGYDVKVIYK